MRPGFAHPTRLSSPRGREDAIDWLESRLIPGQSLAVCAIEGLGGIGKTALAVHVARRAAGHFPDGQIVIPLNGSGDLPLTADSAMGHLIRAFKPELRPFDRTAAAAVWGLKDPIPGAWPDPR